MRAEPRGRSVVAHARLAGALHLAIILLGVWSDAVVRSALVAESSLCLWLLAKGMNAGGWQARVQVAAHGP